MSIGYVDGDLPVAQAVAQSPMPLNSNGGHDSLGTKKASSDVLEQAGPFDCYFNGGCAGATVDLHGDGRTNVPEPAVAVELADPTVSMLTSRAC